jgi:hypothetical protein
MCFIVNCKKCGKKTWMGCGKHVDLLKVNVPVDERCEHVNWD